MPKTALHMAAQSGTVQSVVNLLNGGAQVTCWDKVRPPPPSRPAATNPSHRPEAERMISSVQDGWTPLHHACRYNRADIAKELINRGADVNAKNKVRRTCIPPRTPAFSGALFVHQRANGAPMTLSRSCAAQSVAAARVGLSRLC